MNRRDIEERSILVGLVGSQAYGLADESSDKDYKGIFIAPIEYQLGLKKIEQKDSGWNEEGLIKELEGVKDICLYEFKKILYLLIKNNPTCLELLYLDEYLILNSYGERLIKNRDIFLSKNIKHTYSGYAYAQIKRVESHRKWLLNPPKYKPILKEFGLEEFNEKIINKQELNSFLEFLWFLIKDKIEYLEEISQVEELRSLLLENIDFKAILKRYPLSDEAIRYVKDITYTSDDFIYLLQQSHKYKNAKDDWDNYQKWLKGRNKKRAETEQRVGYDVKHLSHCLRLLYKGIDLLVEGTLKVNIKDKPYYQFIKNIKEGKVDYKEVREKADSLFMELDKVYLTSKLPKTPNYEAINNLSIDILSDYLFKV